MQHLDEFHRPLSIAMISDTHASHRDKNLHIPYADVLIHCGDCMGRSFDRASLGDFANWFMDQPHPHKILVPGNHDGLFQRNEAEARSFFSDDTHILIDESVDIYGRRFYGMPWTAPFYDWYFMAGDLGMEEYVAKIPMDTDVLITHGPPYGILDEAPDWDSNDGRLIHVGCAWLAKAYAERKINPQVHCFGHIHRAYGEVKGSTHFFNCALLGEDYMLTNKPYLIEIN